MKTIASKRARFTRKAGLFTVLQLALAQAYADPISLSNTPLFLSAASKANVLMLYGNSNSMDSEPSGKAVGSDKPTSKSEVARKAIKDVITKFGGQINMGLLAYQQNALKLWWVHDSQYDVSYNSADYDKDFSGARNSQTKKFRLPNPVKADEFIYYNVNLPFYASSSQGTAFCYAPKACTDTSADHDFVGHWGNSCNKVDFNVEITYPADNYYCFSSKTGMSNAAPEVAGSGYATKMYNGNPTQLSPTDADYAQGISDFGKNLTWQAPVGRAWYDNSSPGKGYLHIPIKLLDKAQSDALNVKLATTTFVTGQSGTDKNAPLQNGGLTPLPGTVLTANEYFNGKLANPDQGGPATVPVTYCSKNFLVALTDGLPSVTIGGVASLDKEAHLKSMKEQVTALLGSKAKAETYIVGFALPYGVLPSQLDEIAAAGGSGAAYYASDKAGLDTAFNKIFLDILQKSAAGAAVALSSQSVPKDAHVYQAKFDAETWTGQLLDYAIQSDGSLSASAQWDAGARLKLIGADDRVILTSNDKQGVAFRWPSKAKNPGKTELTAAQMTALNTNSAGVDDGYGELRLDYLRGSAVKEADNASPKFRDRKGLKLGDMVNSAPLYVGAPSSNYNAEGYSDFRAAQAKRANMIYIGANDGMLHGFTADKGDEKIAYVPTGVYGNLSRLTDPGYGHRFFVDGSPNSGDVFYNKAWHTVLVGSMGAGAKGIFALDITKPADFTEGKAASLVNFEYTDKQDGDVGHIAGPVSVVKMNNGKWAALFGNGYNGSSTGESALFVVDIETGEQIAKLATGEGSVATPNALATPLAIDGDSDLTVDVVYAGDLKGNMWKFDLSDSDPKNWKVAYKLFQAPQPITTAPDAGEHPKGGYMVFFGTGKYIEESDITSKPGNAVYGIWDKGGPQTAPLVGQTLKDIEDIKGIGYREATKNPLDWAINGGWKVTLPSDAERVVSDPVLRGGRLIFTSIIPSGDVCKAGGKSWLNEVEWLTGGMLTTPPFDTDLNGVVDKDDALAEGRSFDSIVSGAAIQKSPTGPNLELKFFNESTGAISSVTESANAKHARRLSWRQIK